MAEVDNRRRESSPDWDLDWRGTESVEWHETQLEISRLSRPTAKQTLAAFVNTVEKAVHYFDFRDFLAQHYGCWKEFLKSGSAPYARLPSQIDRFNALSTYDIDAAVDAHIFCLREAMHQHQNEDAEAHTARAPSPPKDPASTLLDRLKEEDSYAFSAPTFRVVFLARNRLYDMDLSPEKELQKIKSSPGYRGDYIIFDEPATEWSEKGANAAIVARKYAEACNKYRSLVSGLSKEVKAPEERRMSDERRKREQHAKEGGKGEKGANGGIVAKKYEEACNIGQGANAAIVAKKNEEACNRYRSLVLGLPKEVKAPKERRMSEKKRKIECSEEGCHVRKKSAKEEGGMSCQKENITAEEERM